MPYRLGISTGFAVNRYPEPEEWVRIIGKNLGLRYAQFTADLLNPHLPDELIEHYLERINQACKHYQVTIRSTFTGAYTRVNHLAHPNPKVRKYWVTWFKRYVDMSVALGATSMGSHFGIFSESDCNNTLINEKRRQENIEHWHEIAQYAAIQGLQFISWEPMSIAREQGETIQECKRLQDDVNKNAPLPFKLCLDVDHGDVCSLNPDDKDPYMWLKIFAKDAPLIHLKQTTDDKSGHWPFTAEFNKNGKITPEKLLVTLSEAEVKDVDLILELSFKEREPTDSRVLSILQESVEYWRKHSKDRLQ